MNAPSWHIITSEYPPDLGGVSDFAAVLASVLPGEVHVWAPGSASEEESNVHRLGGVFDRAARTRLARGLNEVRGPRVLLLQWVPHGFGNRSMNVAFCLWLWRRVRFHRDQLEIVVHEPFLSDIRNLRQRLVALVHRIMVAFIFSAARRVHVTIPAWRESSSRYAFGRDLGFDIIPVPTRIEPASDPAEVLRIRNRYAGGGHLLGHFGVCSGAMLPMLIRTVPALLRGIANTCILLIGANSEKARDTIVDVDRSLENRIFATGALADRDLSLHLQACDVLVQPYPDGVTGRRTSAMAALRHGAVVVATSGHLTEPFWKDSGALALVPVAEVEGLTKTVSDLLDDSQARASLARRAQEIYEGRFSAARLATSFHRR